MRSDLGPYTIVPMWLLEIRTSEGKKVSDKALRLYVALGRYADRETGEAHPSRKTLCADVGVSRPVGTTTLERSRDELVDVGALRVQPRFDEELGGRQTSNVYVLIHADPRVPEHRTLVSTGSSSRGVTSGEGSPPTSGEGVTGGLLDPGESERILKTVDGKKVTDEEYELGMAVMAAFSEAAGVEFRSKEYLRAIIMRIREYPELTLEEHTEIIRWAMKNPWWRGGPDPRVVYGKASIFERQMNDRKAETNGHGEGRSGRTRYTSA